MSRHHHLREIAVLPCLPVGLSVEDSYLEKTSPFFDLQFVRPNDALARTLSFLNISKRHFLDLVVARRGINLLSPTPHGAGTGAFRHRGGYAAAWRALTVAHDPTQPALFTDDQFVEIMENASHGGQLAIAGYVDRDFCLPSAPRAVRLTGCFQLGIIDYIWGSGHTVSFNGSLTVDLSNGQIGDAPGYAYDSGCDFVVSHFRFDAVAAADLMPGRRFDAVRTAPQAFAT